MRTIVPGARTSVTGVALVVVLATALAGTLAGVGPAAAQEPADFASALAQAAQANQLVVIDFFTSW